MGRQHQGIDKPGVRQVPEGSGEQGKMEETGCKIICGAPVTLAVKGLMMMMMMINGSNDLNVYLLRHGAVYLSVCFPQNWKRNWQISLIFIL